MWTPVVHIGVHIPECVKHQSHCLRLQFQQSDCNLSNQTAISTIRLQSSQSMNRFYPVVHIGVRIPECVKHPAHCLRLQSQQSDCNLSNLTAISAIRLQSQQSDCNSHNQTAIFTINEQILPCRTYRGPHSRVCQAPIALFQTAISAIRLQSQQSDCNPHNQTAISTIQLQSRQSNCNPSNQ